MTFAILGSIALLIAWMNDGFESQYSGRTYVVDGDSINIDDQKFRLEGIDAPELHQMCETQGKEYSCGRKSRQHLVGLLKQGKLLCKASQHDRYGRLLGRCFVGKLDINAQMVRDGWAVSFGRYYSEENKARGAKSGVWAGAFERPVDWRHARKGDATMWGNDD